MQIRDHGVVQIEQQRQPLVVALQLFRMQGIVDRQGDLIDNQREKPDLFFRIRIREFAAKAKTPEAAAEGGERQHAERLQALVSEELCHAKESGLLVEEWDY